MTPDPRPFAMADSLTFVDSSPDAVASEGGRVSEECAVMGREIVVQLRSRLANYPLTVVRQLLADTQDP